MRPKMSVSQPCITVISHVTSDLSQPALYLKTINGQKYLIGRVGEGLQRNIIERKFRTSKFSGIFLTGDNHWSAVSGLPGFLLSLSERGSDLSKFHTAPGKLFDRAQRIVQTWNYFKFHTSLLTQPSSSEYSDDNLTARPIEISESTSFVIQMKPTRGKFMVEKAKALGIPPGANYSKLIAGESITLPDNTVVKPSDVMGPSPSPVRVIVLDLPTMQHVRAAINDELIDTLKAKFDASDPDYELRGVYYIFQEGVDLNSAEVHQLVSKVSSGSVRSYISHPNTSPNFNTLNDFGEFQATFREEFPEHFTQLSSHPAKEELPLTLKILNCTIFRQMHNLSVSPLPHSDSNPKKKTKHVQIEEEPSNFYDVSSDSAKFIPARELSEPQVVTLGTGASQPSKYRNVSGTLVRSPLFGSIMFDCGEATFNFMKRLYDTEGANQILRELRVLYISHMHADHHLGSLRLIKSWIDICKKENLNYKLIIASPAPFISFVKDWSVIDEYNDDLNNLIEFLDLDSVCVGDRYTSIQPSGNSNIENVASRLGLKFVTCTAQHNCQFSYNGTISTPGGEFKVSYSGDTKPNRFFARVVGPDSHLLIHEATHENELEATALMKGHSTINGALGIAKMMRAKNTVLTHISQRYPKLPTIGSEGAKANDNQYACFAFDGMKASLSQIRDLQEMVPKMSELLENFDNDSDES